MSVNYHYHPRKNSHHKAKKAKTQPAFGATTRCSHSFPCQWACRKHRCGNVSENTENTKRKKKNGPQKTKKYETCQTMIWNLWRIWRIEFGCCSLFLLAGWYQMDKQKSTVILRKTSALRTPTQDRARACRWAPVAGRCTPVAPAAAECHRVIKIWKNPSIMGKS